MPKGKSGEKQEPVRTTQELTAIKSKLVGAHVMANPDASLEEAIRAADEVMEIVDKYSHVPPNQK